MKTKALNAITVLMVWSLSCGCVTKRLWQDAAYNEPSPAPNLQLYYSDAKHDVLVTYDELHPSDAVVRRGYYLLENSSRLARNRKPMFVDLRQTNQLKQVPIVFKGTTPPPNQAVCAIAKTNATTFQLIINTNESESHDLPVYP